FFYNQILPTGNVSAAKTWEWSVPATVRTFAFQVFVDAGAPQETAEKRSVLRWVPQLDGAWLRAIWGASSDTIFAVASDGSIWYYDGTQWSPRFSSTTQSLQAIWGT